MNGTLVLAVLSDGIFAAIAAIGFAVISNPPRKAVFVSALLAAIGHSLRFYLLHNTPLDLVTASLLAAFTIGMIGLFFAKRIHCPTVVFAFPSLLPMVPGMYAYKTVLALIRFMDAGSPEQQNGLLLEIFRNGLTTFFVMTALVIGVSLPIFIFHKQSFMMTRIIQPVKPIGKRIIRRIKR